jgi:hypothetical protein
MLRLPAGARKLSYSIALFILLYFLFSTSNFSSHLASGSDEPSNDNIPIESDDTNKPGGGVFKDYRFLPERISNVFIPLDLSKSRKYHEWNDQTMRELHVCMALENCGPNQTKVALLAAHWFEEAVVRGWRGGEGVW